MHLFEDTYQIYKNLWLNKQIYLRIPKTIAPN